ncbi:MAG TPA: glycoside hydrolase domain-containing protein [Nocardioides sp.]|uniref:glycoside hydrolase domain-containing protein n=1 Tax=Nocardioides sp. TaxID=35761 RepID=UPI002F415E89
MVRPVIAALGGLALVAALCSPPVTAATAATSDGRAHHYDARGLDSCNAPTHSQMAAFWHQTRWWWWGVYIGGVNRACPNTNLAPHWISRELRRGWGLQPIWVGLQAPCANQSGLARMSWNQTRAYKQGRRTARHAYHRVQDLKMNGHTPVVYDMEAFDTSSGRCRRAVKAFVRGWTYQLRDKTPASPGYYGSSCASALTSMWYISPRPSYVWGANYGTGRKVKRMSCVRSDIWPTRLKQYTGGTNVTENGVTLNVDRDCAAGPMYAPRRRNVGVCS